LDRLFTQTTAVAGAFTNTTDLVGKPSLYVTSWTLRLAASADITLTAGQIESIRHTLTDWQTSDVARLAPLERARLAVQGLTMLHLPVPSDIVSYLTHLQRGAQFTYGDNGEAPSWAATQVAIETLGLANTQPSQTIINAVAEQLAPTTLHPDSLRLHSDLLPLWMLADSFVPAEQRAALRESLREVLTRAWQDLAAPEHLNGIVLGALVSVQQIAAANSIDLPVLDGRLIESLRGPDGYVMFSKDGQLTDPQPTYWATRLGHPAPATVAASILSQMMPGGWRSDRTRIDVASSFYSITVAHLLNDHRRDGALRAQVRSWVSDADFALAAHAREAFFAVALAKELGEPVPPLPSLQEQLRQTRDALRTLWLVRLSRLTALHLERDVRTTLDKVAADVALQSMLQIALVAEIGLLLKSDDLLARAQVAVRALKGQGGFRYFAGAASVDARATCQGLALLGGARPSARAPFAEGEATWIVPPRADASNELSPRTLYLGALISGAAVPVVRLCVD
jgi:hypothetical protein